MVKLDKFYTKKEVAKCCVAQVPEIDSYGYIIEPSAGNGSFLNFLPRYTAYDIEPDDERIVQQDFLDIVQKFPSSTLVIGNPPFGKRGCLAKRFVAHSIDLGAETIAFILPNTFRKFSNQRMFSEEWNLIEVYELPSNSFLVDGSEYSVPCSFFVWTKRICDRRINLRDIPSCPTDDFTFLKRGDKLADFVVNGNSGVVKMPYEVTNPKAEHYIRHKNKDCMSLMNIFRQLKFPIRSSVSGGNYWINREDILKAYNEYIRKESK